MVDSFTPVAVALQRVSDGLDQVEAEATNQEVDACFQDVTHDHGGYEEYHASEVERPLVPGQILGLPRPGQIHKFQLKAIIIAHPEKAPGIADVNHIQGQQQRDDRDRMLLERLLPAKQDQRWQNERQGCPLEHLKHLFVQLVALNILLAQSIEALGVVLAQLDSCGAVAKQFTVVQRLAA